MNNDVIIQFFKANGYAVINCLFSAAEIAEMRDHYMDINKQGTHPGDFAGVESNSIVEDPLKAYPRLIQMHNYDAQTQEWMNDPRLIDTVEEMIGQPAELFQTMVYFKPPGARGQSFHQDCLYIRKKPLIAAWTALDKCTAENGAMEMVLNTHKAGLLPAEFANTEISFTDSQTVMPKNAERKVIEMEPGDVLFFGGFTMHGSMPNRSKDSFRRAFICHYVGVESEEVIGPPLPGVNEPH